MTMQYTCNCCGETTDAPQWGPEDSASGIEPSGPPAGWRAIYTVIEVSYDNGGFVPYRGEVSHACPDCSSYMDPEEHLEAELVTRRNHMRNGKV